MKASLGVSRVVFFFKSSFNPEIEGRNLKSKRKIKVTLTYNESLFQLFFFKDMKL